MRVIRQFVVDAFTDQVFSGNPAAVCILDHDLPDDVMQRIAEENRFSETAFVRQQDDNLCLRWFTPGGEIDLCGHATLASAFVVLGWYTMARSTVTFSTRSGNITVERAGKLFAMDFPIVPLRRVEVTRAISDAAGAVPVEAWLGRDLMCVFETEKEVRQLAPDQEALCRVDGLLFHATARGSEADCVSRSFAPKLKVEEDPVCGSGHCHIAPYWARRLGKRDLIACQVSRRGGTLHCRMAGDRIILAGAAALYSIGDLYVPECGD